MLVIISDLHLGDGTTGHGRQQDTAQCVAERVAEAALKRFQRDPCVVVVDHLDIHDTGFQEFVDITQHVQVPQLLLGIQLNDQMLVDVGRQFSALRT